MALGAHAGSRVKPKDGGGLPQTNPRGRAPHPIFVPPVAPPSCLKVSVGGSSFGRGGEQREVGSHSTRSFLIGSTFPQDSGVS
jgi:hypothetical protein